MKKKNREGVRPTSVRFNLWLLLVCFLLAVCIWAAVEYIGAPAAEEATASLAAREVFREAGAWPC